MLEDTLSRKLEKRKGENLLRQIITTSGLVDFVSNDYLGLAQSKELSSLIQDRIHQSHHLNGATGSRLLSGNNEYTEEVERKLAQLFISEAALIFNSGYTANLAILSSLPQRGDTILYDALAHACLKDGARLSLANRVSFRHNDLHDLEQKLKKASGQVFIAVESVYSMDGDQCALQELVSLAEHYKAHIVLDEAHSTGVHGSGGSGLACELGLHNKIPVRLYTFGKAMGIHGACVAGSKKLIEYLINFARPFIYTTALPPHSIVSIDCAFDYLKNNPELQHVLQRKIKLYTTQNKSEDKRYNRQSPIQTAVFPGNENARQAAASLQKHGFDVRAILSPTVLPGTERLRICLHTFNHDEDIIRLSDVLQSSGVI